MGGLFRLMFPLDRGLAEARAENQAARQKVVEKVRKAKNEGATVSLSREALKKLKAKEYGVH